jgi:hypothetical protein
MLQSFCRLPDSITQTRINLKLATAMIILYSELLYSEVHCTLKFAPAHPQDSQHEQLAAHSVPNSSALMLQSFCRLPDSITQTKNFTKINLNPPTAMIILYSELLYSEVQCTLKFAPAHPLEHHVALADV